VLYFHLQNKEDMIKQLLTVFIPLLVVACSNKSSKTAVSTDGFITAKGEFYCEGMVAADGPGCMIKIDGIVYKMERENNEMYEENVIFDKAGKPVQMEVVYKKTGKKFRMMGGADGPEIIVIQSAKVIE
jgi:hypothetical protein